eukprot:4140324-Amphidinium_carterae.1
MVLKYETEDKRRHQLGPRAPWGRFCYADLVRFKHRSKQDRMRRTQVSKMVRDIQCHLTPAEKASEHLEAEHDLGISYFDDVSLRERKGHRMNCYNEHWDRAAAMLEVVRAASEEQS